MKLKIICGAIVIKDDKFAIVQEAKKHVRGLWNIPAGHLETNENIYTGTIREIKEEIGLDVELEGLIGVYQHKSKLGNNIVSFYFHASVAGGELKNDLEKILHIKWVTFDEFLNYDNKTIRAPHLKEVVNDYVKKGSINNRIYIKGL